MTDTRILIVDDAPEIRRLIEAVINAHDLGWRVIGHARNGQEGVELAGVEQPDLVLLDLSMPVMDGIEALPLLHQAAPKAIIVILSGFPTTVARDSAVQAGANGYIEKSDLLDTLIPQLESLTAALRATRADAT